MPPCACAAAAREGEAEARAAGLAAARRLDPVEGLLDLAELGLGDARAAVGDLDRQPRRRGREPRPVRAAIFDRRSRSDCGSRGAADWAGRARSGAPSGAISTSWPSARNSSTTASASAPMSTARGSSTARPERASASVSSSIAVISSMVAIIRSPSSSGSTLSARIRSEASGVRRSWPIAPSIRSFSSSIALDPLAHRVEGEDRAAQVGRAARLAPAAPRRGPGSARRRRSGRAAAAPAAPRSRSSPPG